MDEGSWSRVPRHDRICLLCNLGSLCDEKHVVFECPALQGLRDEYATLFSDVCTMKQFLWQDDLVSVAKFIHACLDKMFSCATGLSNDSQASDQPDVAGRDVIMYSPSWYGPTHMVKPRTVRTQACQTLHQSSASMLIPFGATTPVRQTQHRLTEQNNHTRACSHMRSEAKGPCQLVGTGNHALCCNLGSCIRCIHCSASSRIHVSEHICFRLQNLTIRVTASYGTPTIRAHRLHSVHLTAAESLLSCCQLIRPEGL